MALRATRSGMKRLEVDAAASATQKEKPGRSRAFQFLGRGFGSEVALDAEHHLPEVQIAPVEVVVVLVVVAAVIVEAVIGDFRAHDQAIDRLPNERRRSAPE